MTNENKKAEEALKESPKKDLEDAIEELKHPKFPKMVVGYMYSTMSTPKSRRMGRSDADE